MMSQPMQGACSSLETTLLQRETAGLSTRRPQITASAPCLALKAGLILVIVQYKSNDAVRCTSPGALSLSDLAGLGVFKMTVCNSKATTSLNMIGVILEELQQLLFVPV